MTLVETAASVAHALDRCVAAHTCPGDMCHRCSYAALHRNCVGGLQQDAAYVLFRLFEAGRKEHYERALDCKKWLRTCAGNFGYYHEMCSGCPYMEHCCEGLLADAADLIRSEIHKK